MEGSTLIMSGEIHGAELSAEGSICAGPRDAMRRIPPRHKKQEGLLVMTTSG